MKSLRQSIIDYDIALLKAIALCRAVPITNPSTENIINTLVDTLLSPVDTAIVINELSAEEKEALHFLLAQNGQTDGPRFARQYGVIRQMGPARLERERPWENPANPAEGLWYKGIIYKAFQVTELGGQELVYIPADMLPLFSSTISAHTPSAAAFNLTTAPEPDIIISGKGRLRENFFSLLVHLQTHPVRLQKQSALSATDKQSLIDSLLPPVQPVFTAADELDFLLHLGQRAGLLTVAHGRLRPERNAVRNWLQAAPAQQMTQLQNAWRADPTWNDLWHVPGLVPQPTGWENSPLKARSKILEHLKQCPGTNWLVIDDFINIIKQKDPDFQRPNGDYESWYIQDNKGHMLMGFEHWDQIEGGLIQYVLTHILPLLGVVDLGGPAEAVAPTTFRLTPVGEVFLAKKSITDEAPQKTVFLRVNEKFYVRVPPQTSLYDRFQLARFAQFDNREQGKIVYKITRASISRAVKNGVTPDQIMAFLTRATNNQIPLNIVEALRSWGTRYASAKLEQATILRLKDETVLVELRKNPTVNHLLGEHLGPATLLVAPKNVAELRRLLTDLGYLDSTG